MSNYQTRLSGKLVFFLNLCAKEIQNSYRCIKYSLWDGVYLLLIVYMILFRIVMCRPIVCCTDDRNGKGHTNKNGSC